MKIREITSAIEAWAPPPLAESYDNVGLLVGDPNEEATGALVNLDVTDEVLDEAKSNGINLVITHHPIWFRPRNKLNGEDFVSRIIIRAIREGINLYACHTNLDNIHTGVNNKICDKLGLGDRKILSPKAEDPNIGSGMIGELEQPMEKEAFLAKVKSAFDCGVIRYSDSASSTFRKVAVCGGSGSFLIADALKAGADAFVTGDITYHKFFENEEKMLLLDIGHFESEQFTSELMRDFLLENFPKFAVRLSKVVTNPVKYF